MMHIRESASPRQKTVPKNLPIPFMYHPSDDGTDENLLILLHGLGASSDRACMSSANIAKGILISHFQSWVQLSNCLKPQ